MDPVKPVLCKSSWSCMGGVCANHQFSHTTYCLDAISPSCVHECLLRQRQPRLFQPLSTLNDCETLWRLLSIRGRLIRATHWSSILVSFFWDSENPFFLSPTILLWPGCWWLLDRSRSHGSQVLHTKSLPATTLHSWR